MPRLKATIEYDGTDFKGWQYQPEQRTVQAVVQETLAQRFGRITRVHGSGRTDSGVHATGQVAHFNAPKDTDPDALKHSLNAMLPHDIKISKIEVVPITFHARFHAVSRTYKYEILLKPSVFNRRFNWQYRGKLNAAAMQRSFHMLLGTHDFKPFSKLRPDQNHYRCTVFAANVNRNGEQITISIRANRFLHSMVRSLVGTLVDVGRGAKSENIFTEVIASGERENASELAPPQGLYLEHVQYQDIEQIRKLI